MAKGRISAAKPINLRAVAHIVGRIFPNAFLKSRDAPIAINPIGVATEPRLETVLSSIYGTGNFIADHKSPTAIPIIMGFVTIPKAVFLTRAVSGFFE